jgi:hypothetical protein
VCVHRAVLASCSPLLSSLLAADVDRNGGGAETDLILPECDQEDFIKLVAILYGENSSNATRNELDTNG